MRCRHARARTYTHTHTHTHLQTHLTRGRHRLAQSSYALHFGAFRSAAVALALCDLVDHACASFLSTPVRRQDEELVFVARACSIVGRWWDQPEHRRAGGAHFWRRKKVLQEFVHRPPMARAGRQDSRWLFPEDDEGEVLGVARGEYVERAMDEEERLLLLGDQI